MSDVHRLAVQSGLVVGNTVNVVFTVPDAPAMLRRLTSVTVREQGGSPWVEWRWVASGSTPWGTSDCGHAGNRLDDAFLTLLEGAGL